VTPNFPAVLPDKNAFQNLLGRALKQISEQASEMKAS
jgi:hypothetical protein